MDLIIRRWRYTEALLNQLNIYSILRYYRIFKIIIGNSNRGPQPPLGFSVIDYSVSKLSTDRTDFICISTKANIYFKKNLKKNYEKHTFYHTTFARSILFLCRHFDIISSLLFNDEFLSARMIRVFSVKQS